MRTAPVAALIAALALPALCGCAPPGPAAGPHAAPSITPLFASDEEALAAAEQAYAAYLAMSDRILSEGGSDGARIEAFAVGQAREAALDGYEAIADSKYRAVGSATVTRVALQHFAGNRMAGADILGMYICVDVSHVDVLDSAGISVVHATRPDIQSFELSFDIIGRQLVLSSQMPWPVQALCG